MSKFLSGRLRQLLVGITGYTENKTVLQTTGKVGIGTTDAQQHSLFVVGSTNITGNTIVGGGLTAVGIGSFQSDVYIDQELYVGGVNITGGATIGEDVSTRNLLVSGISTFQGSVHHPDDVVVNFGNSDDLKIYHDSAGQSYIRDVGTGDLNLTSDGTGIHLQSGTGESLARFNNDGSADLYYDSQRRFATSGVGATVFGRLDSTEVNVSSAGTFGGLIDANGGIDATSAKVEDLTNDRIVIAGVGGELEDSPNLTFDGSILNVVGHTELDDVNVSGTATITSLDVQTDFDVYDTTATFHNNLYVAGNLSIGGTTTTLNAQDLQIFDKDIILGVTTDAFGNDISTDITANHGGIAIASTEGSPLVPFFLAGVNEDIPDTYKQIMWVKSDSYGFGTTDAWLFNYAVGIGSTLVPNGTRFAVSEIQFTDDAINTPNINVAENANVTGDLDVDGHTELDQLNVSGVSTFNGTTEVKNSSFKVTNSSVSGQYLEIVQNGNSSLNLNKVGAGSFFIEGNNIYLGDDDSAQTYAGFERNGKVYLNHNGITRLETTGYGVTIYNDLNVGTGVTIYGNAGIVSAISFYGDGSNLTNTGATLGNTTGVERLVTTQLTSGTMVDAATDADLTYNATTDLLSTPNVAISGGISTDGTFYGNSGQLLRSRGGGEWEWATVPGIFSVNNILNGFNVSEEGSIVGTAGSITQIDFRGINVTASADPQPNGIATITFSSTPTFDSVTVTGDLDVDGRTELDTTNISETLNVVGIATFASNVDINGDLDVDGHTELDNLNVSGVSTFGGTITAVDANFSGNVTIGGTLTYEDVTNIDSVGVITARGDVEVGGNLSVVGITTLASAGGITTTGGDLYVGGDLYARNLVYADSSAVNFNITGIATFGGQISAGGTTGTDGQYLRSTGVGVTWSSFPTLRTTQTNVATDGQTSFNFVYNINFLDVFVNGIKLTTSEYTASNGTQIVLASPAFGGDIIEFHSYNTVSTGSGGGGGGGGASLLNDLGDVTIGTLSDDQILQYNSLNGQWENVTLSFATEAFVGLATAGLASETYVDTQVGLATAGLASETYVGLATAGLASETYVGLATAGLASEAFVGLATAGLASEAFVGLATAGLASEAFVGLSTAGLASETYVGLSTAGLLSSTGDGSNLTGLTGASAATYGNGSAVPQITVDANGRITNISNVLISGGGGGGSSLIINDNGSLVGTAGTIDFGTGLSVSPVSAGIVTVTGITTADVRTNSLVVSGVSTFSGNVRASSIFSSGTLYTEDNDNNFGSYSFGPSSDGLLIQTSSANYKDIKLNAVGGNVKIGTGVTINNTAGIITASGFVGDGSGLTGIGTDLVSTWTLGANGTSHYTFTGPGVAPATDDPTIYLVRGQTYKFENRSGGHPFRIQYEYQNTGGTAYNDGIVNNAAGNGTDLYWEVRNDAPDVLFYQCTAHTNMSGKIIIMGETKTEGSWTAAAGTLQNIDTITGIANNNFKTVEYTLHIEHSSGMQAQKVLAMQTGSTAFSQEFAIMYDNNLLVSVGSSVHNGNFHLNATPETGVTGITTYRFTRQTIR